MDSAYRESLWKRANQKLIARALWKAREQIMAIPGMVKPLEGGGYQLHHALFLSGANGVIALVEASLANELDHRKMKLDEVAQDYLKQAEFMWEDHIQFVGKTINEVRKEAVDNVTVPLYGASTLIEAMSLCAFLKQGGIQGRFLRDGDKSIIHVKPADSTEAIAGLYDWLSKDETDTQLLKRIVGRRLNNGQRTQA
jgi:hypothetical protein